MDLGIRNKVAFVAASSQGLGKSVALELAKEDSKVIICSRNADALRDTAHEIEQSSGSKVYPMPCDLSSIKNRQNLVEEVLKKFNNVDILVTNSGGPPSGVFEDFSDEDWKNAHDQLLASTVGLIRGFLPGMKQKKWGRIVCITSMAVKQPVPNLILSNSVRASIAGLVKTLSQEVGLYNITVNNVMPGYTRTRRLEKLIEQNPAFSKAIDEIPLGRFAEPGEFAAAVAFLASERAGYITGTSLPIDGGWIRNIL